MSHKKSPWLKGSYSIVAEDEVNKSKSNLKVYNGLDSTSVQTATISVKESNSYSICSGSEKGVKRFNEDVVVLIPSLHAYLKGLTANELIAAGFNEGAEPGTRSQINESLDVSIIGVLDGHGGRRTADYVQKEFPLQLGLALLLGKHEDIWDDVKRTGEMIGELFIAIDRKIVSEVSTSSREGCTATLLIVPLNRGHSRVYCANVGDSPAYLWRAGTLDNLQGSLKESTEGDEEMVEQKIKLHAIHLTSSHKPFSLSEKERILLSDATIERGRVNGSLDVSRSFGDMTFKRFGVSPVPSISHFDFEESRDQLVCIFSDGLNVLGDGHRICRKLMETMVASHKQLLLDGRLESGTETLTDKVSRMTVCSAVDEAISEYKCQDNVTLILMCLTDLKLV